MRNPVAALAALAPMLLLAFALAPVGLPGCAAGNAEGLDPETVPKDVRADYAVFAQRCSKCHSLARPLNSGITEDAYWSMYVERMRRQPSSGISHQDAKEILRFLHYYAAEQRRLHQHAAAVPGTPRAPRPAPAAASSARPPSPSTPSPPPPAAPEGGAP